MEEEISRKSFASLIYENFGPDNSSSKTKLTLEFMIYFVGFLGTVLSLVQAYKIWFLGNVTGGIISWIALAAFTPFWILYGIIHKKKSLVMTYVVWLVINLIIIAGILMN